MKIEVVPHTDTSDLANHCQVGMEGGCQERRDSKHKLHYRDEIQLGFDMVFSYGPQAFVYSS